MIAVSYIQPSVWHLSDPDPPSVLLSLPCPFSLALSWFWVLLSHIQQHSAFLRRTSFYNLTPVRKLPLAYPRTTHSAAAPNTILCFLNCICWLLYIELQCPAWFCTWFCGRILSEPSHGCLGTFLDQRGWWAVVINKPLFHELPRRILPRNGSVFTAGAPYDARLAPRGRAGSSPSTAPSRPFPPRGCAPKRRPQGAGSRRGRPVLGARRQRAAERPCHALPRPGDQEFLQGQPAEAAHAGDDADGPEGHRDVAGRLPAGGGGGGSSTRRRLRAGPELRPAGRRRAALAAVGWVRRAAGHLLSAPRGAPCNGFLSPQGRRMPLTIWRPSGSIR